MMGGIYGSRRDSDAGRVQSIVEPTPVDVGMVTVSSWNLELDVSS